MEAVKLYPSTFHVAHDEDTGMWLVFRANVGGDVFFVEEFETQMAAQWRRAELVAQQAHERVEVQ